MNLFICCSLWDLCWSALLRGCVEYGSACNESSNADFFVHLHRRLFRLVSYASCFCAQTNLFLARASVLRETRRMSPLMPIATDQDVSRGRRLAPRAGAAVMLLLGVFAAASSRGADHAAEGPPTNLRVLPGSIRPADLDALMKRYARDLGVQCGYCHVEDPATGRTDYAADDAPAKQSARLMIAMVEDINTRYIAQLGDLRYVDPVTCGTCHRGSETPAAVATR
jgi:hypothetical protein